MVGTAMVVQGMAVGFVGTDQLVAQIGTGKEMVVIVKLVVSALELVALTGTDEEMVFVFVMRDPQRCRRTDDPTAHCDCLTAMHVSSVPSRPDTSGCKNSCTG
ncbi:hypothetical protein DPMN_161748 [Dreissena polymorpha]|uniref:Uncharacterized protein n=1 Tax=Dreissena polymorpha TaxID=45954 RepID=A0A9D4ITN6_DREPO|nr:hypothetical protein DPMN_161748 [Dreissena polymorpha]